jgi:hypothetical protein
MTTDTNIDPALAAARKTLARVVRWWVRGELGEDIEGLERHMRNFAAAIESNYNVECIVRTDYDEVKDALAGVVLINGREVAREPMPVLPRAVAAQNRSERR